jgi:hypothetical protein
VLGPALERIQHDPRVVEVCRGQRALLGGIAANLDGGTQKRAIALLAGPVGGLLDPADLSAYPRLREFILFDQVHKKAVTPVVALGELVALRHPANPLADSKVLRKLWPDADRWTADETRQLLDHLQGATSSAVDFLQRSIAPPDDPGRLDEWLALVDTVRRHPTAFALLPAVDRERILQVEGLDDKLHAGAAAAQRFDRGWYPALEADIRGLGPVVDEAIRVRLAVLIVHSRCPGDVLMMCPEPVFRACCKEAAGALNSTPREHELAARLVAAASALRKTPRYQTFGRDVVATALLTWPRRDRQAVRRRVRLGVFSGPPSGWFESLTYTLGWPSAAERAAMKAFDVLITRRRPARSAAAGGERHGST